MRLREKKREVRGGWAALHRLEKSVTDDEQASRNAYRHVFVSSHVITR